MNLRTVTIGLSAAVLLGTIGFGLTIGGLNELTVFITLFLPLCCFPQIVSIVISICTRHPVSQILSATASLLYTFNLVGYIVHTMSGQGNALIVFCLGILHLPILLPLWITALVIDVKHRKKTEHARIEP